MAADVLARHHAPTGGGRLLFDLVTDEHGEPIEDRRQARGDRAPATVLIRNAKIASEALMPNQSMPPTTSSSAPQIPCHYSRSSPNKIMQRVYDNGWVEKRGSMKAGIARAARTSKPRRGGPPQSLCPIHEIGLDTRAARRTGSSDLSAFQPRLEALYRGAAPTSSSPRLPRQRGGLLHQRGAGRTSRSHGSKLKWGDAGCPGLPSQRMYVWFDALLNYVTAFFPTNIRPPGGGEQDLTARFWPAHYAEC